MWHAVKRVREVHPTTGMPQTVLFYLAVVANEAGVCWPSVGRMAKDLGWGATTVRRALRVLEAIGEIKVETRPGRTCLVSLAEHYLVRDPGRSDRGGAAASAGGGGRSDTRNTKEPKAGSVVVTSSQEVDSARTPSTRQRQNPNPNGNGGGPTSPLPIGALLADALDALRARHPAWSVEALVDALALGAEHEAGANGQSPTSAREPGGVTPAPETLDRDDVTCLVSLAEVRARLRP